MAHLMEQQFGNYRLIRLLGQGGFADVYLGEHVHLNTLAAIKVLRAQLVADEITNFRTEARTIAHLAHPNIVRVLDFDVQGTMPFLVMDYAPNGNLRQFHSKGVPLSPQVVVSYIKQVAAALEYAHQRNLIHRDVKPENMLLGQNREVLLSDFGIALVTESILAQSQRNSASDAAGTAIYMAPEQQQGHPRPASDQYALGVIAYEWLCGVRPFNGTYMEVAIQHMQAPPPSMREILPTISPDIEKVVFIALAKDPQRRFKSVQAFANALEQACREEATYLVSDPNRSQHPAEKKEQAMEITLHGPFGRKVLGPAPLTIGKAQDNQLVLTDPKVSAHHAEIRPAGQGYIITDSGSTNGTFVNGQWLTRGVPYMLNQGDTIRMGDTTLTYVVGPMQQSGNIASDGSTQRADYAYQQVDNPYQNPYTGYGWDAPQQQMTPAAPPPSIASTPPNMQSAYTPIPSTVPRPLAAPTPPYVQLPYTPVPQPTPTPKPTNWPRILIIALVIVVLVGASVGTIAYLTRPQPVISVTSKYTSGSTPAGSTGTAFHVSGQKFSANSAITFLLDGTPIPGNATVQSDANGNVSADLTVTNAWTIGNHTLTAKDAGNDTTQSGFPVAIVPQGEAGTPGPNGAPPDDMSFHVAITVQSSASSTPFQETLVVTGQPDPAGGTVCESVDNGQPVTFNGDFGGGLTYTRTSVYTCSGTYKGGKLSYTEMASVMYSLSDGGSCKTPGPFVLEHLEGTFSSGNTISGSYSDAGSSAPCTDNKTVTLAAQTGTWTGQIQ